MTVSVTNPQNHFRVTAATYMQVHSFYADPIGRNGWGQQAGSSLSVGFCPTFRQIWAITPSTTHVVSGNAKSLYSERCLT